ncbi:MAG: transposase [Actinomycetota bacterium]|nr:transposase [Actinomycetota bacterium]
MPRKSRGILFEGIYHVTSRGNNQSSIFLDDTDKIKFLDMVAGYKRKFAFRLFSYALLTNHFHLLISLGYPSDSQVPLSKIMGCLLTSYSTYFNRRHNRSGHVFQGRYGSRRVENDAYLLQVIRYIHLNPVMAGLCEQLEDWRFSSHRCYLGFEDDPLVDKEEMLFLFAKRPTVQIKRYENFIHDGLKLLEAMKISFEEKFGLD